MESSGPGSGGVERVAKSTGGAFGHDVSLGRVETDRLIEYVGGLVRSLGGREDTGQDNERVGVHVDVVRLLDQRDRLAGQRLGLRGRSGGREDPGPSAPPQDLAGQV